MDSFNKKFITIIFAVTALPSVAFGQATNPLCSSGGYTIETINGVFTDEAGAIANKKALDYFLPDSYHGESVTIDYLFNPSHLEGLGDITKVVYQKLFENEAVGDYDLIEMINDASQKVKTQKILLVAHSQGNFYANSFYDTVTDKAGGVPAQSIGVYSVATPASRVAGGGRWLTSDTDQVIAKVAAIPLLKVLALNTHIILTPEVPSNGHSFSEVYLKYRSTKIVADIQASLDKLSLDPARREDAPCINPPELTIGHKIEGVALAMLDNAAYSVRVTGAFASNMGLALARATTNTFYAIGTSAYSAFLSLLNGSSGALALNNSASLILATTVGELASLQQPLPEAQKVTSKTPAPVFEVSVPVPLSIIPLSTSTKIASTTVRQVAIPEIVLAPEPRPDYGGGTPAPEIALASSATATTKEATTTPIVASTTPETHISPRTLYSKVFIGTPVSVGGRWGDSSAVSFNSGSRAEDVYRVRVKKASDFNCRTDASGYIVAGNYPFNQRIAELETSTATTDGSYCEYKFTEARTFIPASPALTMIGFSALHNGAPALLDGSLANGGYTMDPRGIWNLAPTFAFQLCGVDGCDGKFVFPPDGVTPVTPTNQTYLRSPTFSGTYNNNAILNTQVAYNNGATFDKIVFEFKNNSLDTPAVYIARPITTNGSVLPYTEQIEIGTPGDWQYRARLEDTVNASSTPWSSLAFFTFAPRTPETQAAARTVYENPYIGTPVSVGGRWGDSSAVAFNSSSRTEDVYSVRIKKASDFDCKTEASGQLVAGNYPFNQRIVELDTANAITDGVYCEYAFTEARTAIPASLTLSLISFSATHNGIAALLDGSIANGGRTLNTAGYWDLVPTLAFQLCNIVGCSGEFRTPTVVLSAARAIMSFDITLASTTVSGVIDETAHTVSVLAPFGADVHTLTPTIIVSPHATVSPASSAPQDFSAPLSYLVTAENGETQTYMVTVTILPDVTPSEI